MKGAILILCLAMTTPAFAQKCKFKKNDVRRDGSVTVITPERMINKKFTSKFFFTSSFAFLKTEYISGDYVLLMKLSAGNENLDTAEGNKLYLTLSDGTEIILKNKLESTAKTIENMGIKSSFVLNSYTISFENLKKIQETGIASIEMATNDKDHKSEVSDKDNKELAAQILCLLNETEQFRDKNDILFK
ncbi:hypothetical protein M2132_002351 [Dysgonomonas sp. PH5-45]|uniref:hypothetical protein n=1 Tax=unclassified Dysgonomonas TaxID=2630389 RepID=UPI00247366CD|nr:MULTISPECIES: hypothetical protein [unclassified Dysgonomonas]MDH6356000.1 hypothetical protein [Dysgonomonas sp. PH5-45]MDH6388895.1 hypothetical protein [Dysgonomonas sp. PH5-37]